MLAILVFFGGGEILYQGRDDSSVIIFVKNISTIYAIFELFSGSNIVPGQG